MSQCLRPTGQGHARKMSLLVPFEVIFSGEFEGAERAGEGLLSRVGEDVAGEVSGVGERGVAKHAREALY